MLSLRATSLPAPAFRLFVVGLAFVMTATTFGSEALARKRKRHRSPANKSGAEQPNFRLDDWLFDARLATRSTSVGQANRGEVLRTEQMDLTGRSWRFLPAIRSRGTQHGTFQLVRLIESAADAVAEEFPGSLVEIGNIGRRDGGPIVQSKSHQAGRDVDIAFFALDSRGRRRPTGQMLNFDDNLKAGSYTFDVERNWALVKALLESEEPVVQWLFVSRAIRTALLEHARKLKEPARLIRLASVVLHQPGDSRAHADHVHVRVFCTDWDRASGCRDYGPDRSSLERDDSLLKERIRSLERRTARGLTAERLAALKVLTGLPGADLPRIVDGLLCDGNPDVVDAAVALLPRTQPGKRDEVLARKLGCAGSPDALYVLFKPITSYQNKRVWEAARKVLDEQACLTPDLSGMPFSQQMDRLCAQATRALGYSRQLADGQLLVPLLDARDRKLRRYALRSLRTLYATRDPVAGPEASGGDKRPARARWQEFVTEHHKEKWAVQAANQLRRQGYAMGKRLVDRANTRELLRAVKSGRPLSFTAQIVLAKLYGQEWNRPLKALAAYKFFTGLEAVEQTAAANRDKPGPERDQPLPELPTLD